MNILYNYWVNLEEQNVGNRVLFPEILSFNSLIRGVVIVGGMTNLIHPLFMNLLIISFQITLFMVINISGIKYIGMLFTEVGLHI